MLAMMDHSAGTVPDSLVCSKALGGTKWEVCGLRQLIECKTAAAIQHPNNPHTAAAMAAQLEVTHMVLIDDSVDHSLGNVPVISGLTLMYLHADRGRRFQFAPYYHDMQTDCR